MASTASMLLASFFLAICSATNARAGERDLPGPTIKRPTSVSHFDYIGCLGSDTFPRDENQTSFTQVEQWEFMNIKQCISDCYHAAYAAITNQTCYCASSITTLDDVDTHKDSSCNLPCPGNADQGCGGAWTSDSNEKTVLLSVYGNTHFTRSEPSSDDSESHEHFDLVRPRGIAIPDPPPPIAPAQTVFPTPISTTYTDICTPTLCPSAYPSERATTITALVTKTSPESVPTVPMRRKSVAYTSTDGAGKVLAMSTMVVVPDESRIEEIEAEIRVWRDEWEQEHGNRGDGQEDVLGQVLEGGPGAQGSGDSAGGNKLPLPDDDADEVNTKHQSAAEEHSKNSAAEDQPAEDTTDSRIERRDDTLSHAAYQSNDHETPFAGIGGLGNVQVMPAQGHWEKE